MILANAKINLFLAITGRYIDNYHELVAFNVPINIYDEINIIESTHWSLNCNNKNLIKENIIHSVIEHLHSYTSNQYQIDLQKNIPIMSGFGGGSSDAIAVLKFFNRKENLGLSDKQLIEIGKQIGADCPFFVGNEPAIVSGIGEIVSPVDQQIIQQLKKYHLVVFKPPFEVETKIAYQALRTKNKELYISYEESVRKLNKFLTSVLTFQDNLPLFNTFSDIIFPQKNELKILQKKLKKIGINMSLSGSGSGCFCIFKDKDQSARIIEIIKNSFKQNIFIQVAKILAP